AQFAQLSSNRLSGIRSQDPPDAMLADPTGYSRVRRSVEQNRTARSQRAEKLRRHDEAFPLRPQTHQMDIRGAEPSFESGSRRDTSHPYVRIGRPDLLPHRLRAIPADAEREPDIVIPQQPRQIEERFICMGAPEIPGIEQTQIRVAKQF